MMLMAPFFVNYFVTILLFLLILNIAIFGAKFGIKKDCYKSAYFGWLRFGWLRLFRMVTVYRHSDAVVTSYKKVSPCGTRRYLVVASI